MADNDPEKRTIGELTTAINNLKKNINSPLTRAGDVDDLKNRLKLLQQIRRQKHQAVTEAKKTR